MHKYPFTYVKNLIKMGCGGSKADEDQTEQNEHDILGGEKWETENGKPEEFQNQCIQDCTTYYLDQEPPKEGTFEDKIFPDDLGDLKKYAKQGEICWMSWKEFYGEEAKMFGDGIQVDDVTQGDVSNDYFTATISALGEFPRLIAQLFRTKTVPENGCVEIALQIEGKWQIVLLDDKFPVYKNSKYPLFCRSKTKELWSLYLEKAWAKINGGYSKIVDGNSRDVFQTVTPFNAVPVDISDEKKTKLWENLVKADQFNTIMTCIIDPKRPAKMGLEPGCFALISAVEKDIGEDKVALVKIRNPLGRGEWQGDWSDKSDKWTEEAKAAFGFEDGGNDGTFWMPFSDFYNYFATINFCIPVRPLHNNLITVPEDKAKNFNVLKIRPKDNGVFMADIKKATTRSDPKLPSSFSVIDTMIFAKVGDKEQREFEYITSGCNEPISAKVESGVEYVLFYYVDYERGKCDKVRPFNLLLSSNVTFEVAENEEEDKNLSLLKQIVEPVVSAKDKYKSRFSNPEVVFFTSNRFEQSSIGLAFFKNPQDKDICLKTKLKLTNLKMIDGKDETRYITLKPNETYISFFNRVKACDPFKSGVSATVLEAEKSGAETPFIDAEKLDKYINNDGFAEPKYDFEI